MRRSICSSVTTRSAILACAIRLLIVALGEDSVLDAPAGFDRFEQIAVELFGVAGIDASVDDEVSFELDVGVARVHIDALDAVGCGRDFGFDFPLVVDDSGAEGEVSECVSDVVFGVAVVVAFENSA